MLRNYKERVVANLHCGCNQEECCINPYYSHNCEVILNASELTHRVMRLYHYVGYLTIHSVIDFQQLKF